MKTQSSTVTRTRAGLAALVLMFACSGGEGGEDGPPKKDGSVTLPDGAAFDPGPWTDPGPMPDYGPVPDFASGMELFQWPGEYHNYYGCQDAECLEKCAKACINTCGNHDGCQCGNCGPEHDCDENNHCQANCNWYCKGHCGNPKPGDCQCGTCPAGYTCSGVDYVCVKNETCIVVDNSDPEFSTNCLQPDKPGFSSVSEPTIGFAENGEALYAEMASQQTGGYTCTAVWEFANVTPGKWDVFVRIPTWSNPPKPLTKWVRYKFFMHSNWDQIDANMSQGKEQGKWYGGGSTWDLNVGTDLVIDPDDPPRLEMSNYGYAGDWVVMADAVKVCPKD